MLAKDRKGRKIEIRGQQHPLVYDVFKLKSFWHFEVLKFSFMNAVSVQLYDAENAVLVIFHLPREKKKQQQEQLHTKQNENHLHAER